MRALRVALGAGLLIAAGTISISGATTPADQAGVAPLVQGNSSFAFDLYAKLRTQEGNLFLSPYSISTALAMTSAGARHETGDQMARTLHFFEKQPFLGTEAAAVNALSQDFAKLITSLNTQGKSGNYELTVANALWGQKDYKFLPEYLRLVEKNYGGALRNVDFAGATEDARKTINSWVEKQTRDKIKDLLKPGILDNMTVLVLTNAIYFKGKWETEFDRKLTKDDTFYVSPLKEGIQPLVPIMHRTAPFAYMEGEGFQALELPYKGKDLSMVVFLPRERDGLPALEANLTEKNVTDWLSKLRSQVEDAPGREVIVSLPRFKMTSEFSLKDVLTSLGMADAFNPDKADFSGMTGNKDLSIGAVIHKAYVDVNEEGTEAAAATAVVMKGESMPAPPLVFKADHPFLFLIRDIHSGSILFLGRLLDPSHD